MGQQPQRTRPFVADPNEWEVVPGDDYETVDGKQAPTWSDKLGLNQGTDSPLLGFLRGAGAGAVDLAQGAVSNVAGQMNSKLDAENLLRQSEGRAQTVTVPRVERPQNFSGGVGAVLPVMAEMALPAGQAAKTAIDALPSAARAGAKFEQVMGAAKDIPVDVEPMGKTALRIMELAENGGSMPMSVRKLVNRITDPSKGPLAYRQARDFASNISQLSVDEMRRLKPVVRRQVAQLAADLNLANANAAKAAGKGVEYKSAMREYANAMRMRDAIDTAAKHSKKAALGAAGIGGAAYWFGRD